MASVVKLNAGGRMFRALQGTLCRVPDSPLAKVVNAHVATLAEAAGAASAAAAVAGGVAAASAAGETAKVRGRRGRAPPVTRDEAETRSASHVVDDGADDDAFGVPNQVHDLVASDPDDGTLFLDVDPEAFSHVLNFLRSGSIELPTAEPQTPLRASILWQLKLWGLNAAAFPPVPVEAGEGDAEVDGDRVVELPETLVVQMCDTLTHDQGIKRHNMSITFGSDGFQLKEMCKTLRRDLRSLLAASHWQVFQTNERAAFFACSKINSGTADLLSTSVTQRVVMHAEAMGYNLTSSYVTLSPDPQHTQVRLFIHNFIFRRTRLPVLETSDDALVPVMPTGHEHLDPRPTATMGVGRRGGQEEDVVFRNFQPPAVGPQAPAVEPPRVPKSQRVDPLWEE